MRKTKQYLDDGRYLLLYDFTAPAEAGGGSFAPGEERSAPPAGQQTARSACPALAAAHTRAEGDNHV